MTPKLPGDLSKEDAIQRILRVDHAGEFGAKRIYEGQLAVLKNHPCEPILREMYEQELQHLKTFEKLIPEYRVRPTLLHPLWNIAGYALGAAAALMGPKAAMACTIAIEEVIDDHYRRQAEFLEEEQSEAALSQTIRQFRDEEIHHRQIGVSEGGKDAPAYELLSKVIKTGSRLAIWLSERI